MKELMRINVIKLMVVKIQFRMKKSCLGHPVYWAKTTFFLLTSTFLDPSKTNIRSFLFVPSLVVK